MPNTNSPNTFNRNLAEELRELSALRDDGIITELEFEKKKQELLS